MIRHVRLPALTLTVFLCTIGPQSALASGYVGAGSCSAAACHNDQSRRASFGNEFTMWATRDPHAKAYEALFNARSVQIQTNLKRSTPAHEDRRCLRCHVSPAYEGADSPAYFKTDGVSCESCHGPAQQWLNVHHLGAWRQKSAAEKKRLGMNDTRSLLGRAQLCTSCHVGGKDMDVDHDLLAAGHPRLHFEFAAFHAHMPRHWPDVKDRAQPNFEARAWLIGQIVSSQTALEVLGERAGNAAKVWPEFAEFDCASCHHSLQAISPRQKLGRRPGAFAWGHQVALTPIAMRSDAKADPIRLHMETLQKLMDAGGSRRSEIAAEAHKAGAALKSLLDDAEAHPLHERDLERMRLVLIERGKRALPESDALTQLHLALAALSRSSHERIPAPALHGFDPEAIRARLSILKGR